MSDAQALPGAVAPTAPLIRLALAMYALHAVSALSGLLGTAFVITAFLSGWPSVIAVILNYLKRGDVRGTWLESHFRWQIRTFWFALAWALVALALALALSLLGLPLAWAIAVGVGLWVIYRIVRGWLTLCNHQPIAV